MSVRRWVSLLVICFVLSASFGGTIPEQVEVRKIPVAKGLASHPVNGGRCLISDGEYQYIAFYDGAHRMTVGKRKLSEAEWDFAKLPERVGWDTHNRVVLFQDRKGYLHVTGNMHCAPLRYYRTKAPADIHTFEAIHTWTGDYEDRVTYPTVLKLRDGSIYIMYRHGGSGNGMRILVHYDERTQQWTKAVPVLTNGRDRNPTCNAYPFGILEDEDGLWHIAWCWRETPDVVTNFDICYAKSLDRGASWKSRGGRDLELPMTPENAHVVEPIGQKSGLLNGGALVVDDKGRPYVGYTRFDENGHNQIYIATPADGKWKIIQLTDWKHRFYFHGRGTIPQYPPVPRVSITEDQKIQVAYDHAYVKPRKGQLALTREQLLTMEPGQYPARKADAIHPNIPHIRAVNRGPLPPGFTHYMQQKTDSPNRDRKPESPEEPTMIYVVEVMNKGHAPATKQSAEPEITAPPESLKLDPFYKKYVAAEGLPIVASEKVADAALLRSRELIDRMLADRPDIRQALIEAGVRFVVIGANEQTTDIPEYSHMKPKEFWNQRARGFGGRIVSCGEENLLCRPIDRYDDENILIHEFAHCIHLMGLRRIDKDFDKMLRRLYEKALDKGLWKGTYAGSNPGEYWAEAVQSHFDANRQNNYNHNHVNTREELQAYDPDLAGLVTETFRNTSETDWRYKPVAKQPQVTSPPAMLECDPFYEKYVRVRGLPILGSGKVSDEALLEANYLTRHMFAYRHDVLKVMIGAGLRLVVVAEDERIADVPEYKGQEILEFDGKLGRVLACTPGRLIIICGEENLLSSPNDIYAGESILIREFARALHLLTGHRSVERESDKKPKQQYELGVKRIDKEFDETLKQLYKSALQRGLWKDTFAATSPEEYWAEGVQSWFDANRQDSKGHKQVNTREELDIYNSDLAKFIAEVFRHSVRSDWRYKRPRDRER